jgi:hypothetical protein
VPKSYNGEKSASLNKCFCKKWLSACHSTSINSCLSLYFISNLEASTGKSRYTLKAIGIGKDFLSRTQLTQQLSERIDKWDYMKLKSFCTAKEMVSKLNRQPTEWEKIFLSYISDKELITRKYMELKKLNSSKINDPLFQRKKSKWLKNT